MKRYNIENNIKAKDKHIKCKVLHHQLSIDFKMAIEKNMAKE